MTYVVFCKVASGTMKKQKAATPASDVAARIIDRLGNSEMSEYFSMISNWQEIVGANDAKKLVPHNVLINKGKKTLVLETPKGYALEIQHEAQHILDKIHNFLGKKYFSAIKVLQMDRNFTKAINENY
jgi:hypothetical protein